ncbi:MAG TPA: dethiobiotin synthase [Gammaproteobacteria bacterium]|nr:dethiobiotin synthase [Gammaproteobacteria bacterium]
MNGVFISGTDTGVGKSLIACALLAGFRRAGLRTAAMKPVASGSDPTPSGLRNEDALQLAAWSDCPFPYEVINPYTFQPAIAPHIAAAQAGVTIDLQRIEGLYRRIAAQADICVVEGAGGWLVPLDEAPATTMADLVVRLDIPVVLVVGMRLGCLNHAMLTAESILARGVALTGWVANQVMPDMPCVEQNIETLQRHLPAQLLGVVQSLPCASPEKAESYLDIAGLMELVNAGSGAKITK